MKLYICATYYHVYITLLKQLKEKQDADLVICDDMAAGEALADRLKPTGLFRKVWFVRQSELPEVRGKSRLDWVLFQHRRRYRALQPLLPFVLSDYSDVYIFHDATPLGMYLADARKPYHLLEDSLNFYQRIRETPQARYIEKNTLKYRLRRRLDSGYFPLGASRWVIDVEVNENRNLQVELPRVIECPRGLLQDGLSWREKQMILDVFGCKQFGYNEKNTALVLTEPLFIDGAVCDEEAQLAIYRDIVALLKEKGYQALIKPHPRDRTDYTVLGVYIVERQFPAELLEYMDQRFGCAVTVSSSTLDTIQAKKRFRWKSGELFEV